MVEGLPDAGFTVAGRVFEAKPRGGVRRAHIAHKPRVHPPNFRVGVPLDAA